MSSLFEKQVFIRLSEDGTGFFYTLKYGRIASVTREILLAEKVETAGLAELSRGNILHLVPVAGPIPRGTQGRG